MKSWQTRALYALLLLCAFISLSYYLAGAAALREEFFHSAIYAESPFDFKSDGQTIGSISDKQKKSGIRIGDVLEQINGRTFTGWAQLNEIVRRAHPGDPMRVQVRGTDGRSRTIDLRLDPREGPDFSVAGYIAFLLPVLGVPLLGLIVGYWVVAVRPRDLNAWLVLVLLSFPETGFGNIDWRFWPGPWFPIFGLWNMIIQHFDFTALLWFGFLFPERWRLDVRLPWLKWLFFAFAVIDFLIELRIIYAHTYDVQKAAPLAKLDAQTDLITGWVAVLCMLLFLIALFDKLRTASTPDARRRLRVLTIGSGLSLGPLMIAFGLLPRFGIDPHNGNWFEAMVPLVVLFPLTLAYVVIVQRAMDVRILLRLGTKYLLARTSIVIVEMLLGLLILFKLVIPVIEWKGNPWPNLILLVVLSALFARLFLMKDSLRTRLQRWLDRKFFREAYDSEVVLSELSEQVRKFIDKAALIEMVTRRISEILHVPQIAVWLRGSSVFHLQQTVGVDLLHPVMLPESSATVQNLAATSRPATLYKDRPESWFAGTNETEREALRSVNAELLLPLPGRENLMGLITLGPKQSEEAYTPTDLRVLQSLAAQTGLALEVSDLVQSLAQEASQRERMNREIEIAREVQQRLFPQKMPDLTGLGVAGFCRPALGVGGDYYDFIQFDDGRLGIAIGDISGKGISAALLMASLQASLRGLTLDSPTDLARMMERMNRLVYEASAVHRYATFFFATYAPDTRELRYVNAGHNAPMWVRNRTGEVVRLEAGGMVIGLLPTTSYETQSAVMEPGDMLICYTDGISEAMTIDDEEWGEDRMLAAAQSKPGSSASEMIQSIFQAADEFTAGAPQHDDMTLLVMKLEAVNQ